MEANQPRAVQGEEAEVDPTVACFTYQVFKLANERFRSKPDQLDPARLRQVEQAVWRQLDLEEAVLSSRDAAGVTVPESQLEEAVGHIRVRYDGRDDFVADLESVGMTPDFLRMALERELRVEAVLERVSRDCPPVSETDASLYYYMNPARFRTPEIRTARHILITINPDFPENQRTAAAARITAIAERLQKKPQRFAEQALKHSECPTAMQGGLMGRVKPGTLFPELEAVLFQLPLGQVSDPVESPLGFHLLFCEAIQPERLLPLEQVLPKIREHLHNEQKGQVQRRWIESLNTAASAAKGRRVHG